MKVRKFIWIFSFFAVIFLINSTYSFADSIPLLPASYYGTITIDGIPAEKNLEVVACIDGIKRGSIETGEGTYGIDNHLRLSVEGSSSDTGKTVYFCIGNKRANEIVKWKSGDVRELPLTFTDKTEGCPCQSEETTNDDTTNGNNGGGGGISEGTSSSSTIENKTNNTATQPTQEPESSEQVTIPKEIKENQEAIFDFPNSKVSSIKILFNEPVENPSLTVEIFDEKPAGVSEISEDKIVYKYISVDKNFDSAKVKQATIKFKVETSWMAENKVGPENIILLHFNINGWEELPTTLTGTEGEFYKFEAETESLSIFAIVAKEKQNKFNVIYLVVIFLMIICLIAFFIKMKTKPQKNKNKIFKKQTNISKKK